MPTLPLAKIVNTEALDDEATVNIGRVGEVEVPSTTKVAVGEVEPMPTLWLAVTARIEIPDEEATLNGFNAPLPCTLKETVEEVAFRPATVPLSNKRLFPSVESPVQTGSLPICAGVEVVIEPEPPPPVGQGEPVVVTSPLVEACIQFPGVSPKTVRLFTVVLERVDVAAVSAP